MAIAMKGQGKGWGADGWGQGKGWDKRSSNWSGKGGGSWTPRGGDWNGKGGDWGGSGGPKLLPANFKIDGDEVYTGIVTQYDKFKGFGWIKLDQSDVVPG